MPPQTGVLSIMRHRTSRGAAFAFLGLFAALCSGGPVRATEAAPASDDDAAKIADATPREALLAPAKHKPEALKPTLRTRFVVGLEHKVDYQVFSLANPSRVVIELPNVKLHLPEDVKDKAVGLVRAFRGGLAATGKTRIVIDVTQPVIVERAKIQKDKSGAWQLALDILPVEAALKAHDRKSQAQAVANLNPPMRLQPPTPKLAESPAERAAKMFKPVIVLDPGHGGKDSGAVKAGTVEKRVVLAFAHVLRERLEKTGRYKILMTRDSDEFIELDERRAFAERNKASLFIAIHADYAGTKARGATIFSLRDGVAKSLLRNAADRAAENVLSDNEVELVKEASGDVNAVRDILADLAERDVRLTHERSNVFAKTVIENMSESTTMRNEPDQQAAFRVLKTAQFPSVLIELAYVSNLQDANNLKSDEWREKVADSICSAIDNYFSNQVARLPM